MTLTAPRARNQVEWRAEPPAQRSVKRRPGTDDPPMAHLLNLISGTCFAYVYVTRGSLAVSRGFTYAYARAR
jgi:hypothetical protein